jgi:RimJ/RimL family protein N-acetyltransferase
MTTPTLNAPNLVLRPLSPDDAEALFAAHGDETTHTYWSSPAHKNIAETRQYIAETLTMNGAYVWAITEDGGDALGRIALFVEREGVGEIGIIMRPDATGRGLASRAMQLAVQYGFNALGLHRIAADIDPDNTSSLSLFLRAGFQREGVLRGNWKTHIGIRDSIIVGKLKGESQ